MSSVVDDTSEADLLTVLGERYALDETAARTLLSVAEPLLRADTRETKLGRRGTATRLKLMESARQLFETHGYSQVSVLQISENAGVSQGAYYQYFRDRSDVMAALVVRYVAELVSNAALTWRVEDGRSGIAQLLDFYVRDYAENAAFAGVWEEISQLEPALADARRRLTNVIERSVEAQLRHGIELGLLSPPGAPATTARALTAMADRFCFLAYTFDPGEQPITWEEGARALTEMWWRVIGPD